MFAGLLSDPKVALTRKCVWVGVGGWVCTGMRATHKNSDVLAGCDFGFCLTKHASWNDCVYQIAI